MNSIIILFMEKKSWCGYKKLVRLMGLLCIGAANRDIFVLSDHFLVNRPRWKQKLSGDCRS